MKVLKTLTVATSLFAMAFANMASAYTTVYLTGSTAYRANTIAGVENILNAAGQNRGWDSNAADANVANHAIIYGTLKSNGHAVLIKTSWSGSGAGVQAVAGAAAGNTFNVSYITTPADPTNAAQFNPNMAVGDTHNGGDIAMSDVQQGTTGWLGSVTYQTDATHSTTKSFTTLSEVSSNGVGVVPFEFVTSPNSPITNMTTQLAQGLWANGQFSLALFTGNSSDEPKYAYATGRDPDSGTRMTAFAETGVTNSNPVVQFQPQSGGTFNNGSINSPITSQVFWPNETVNGTFIGSPNGGYASGGSMSKTLSNDTSALSPAGYYVSYLGTSDAANFLAQRSTSGATLLPAGTTLTYAGVALPMSVSIADNAASHAAGFDTATATTTAGDGTTATSVTTTHTYVLGTNVLFSGTTYPHGYIITTTITNTPLVQGQYSFWSFEHLLYNPALAGDALTAATDLSNDIANTDAQITIPSMNVSRSFDGGVVGSNNY